jgi:hypothetical protein
MDSPGHDCGCFTRILKEESKEFQRGYNLAKKAIQGGADPKELLNQSRSSLTIDDFDRGWKQACREGIEKSEQECTCSVCDYCEEQESIQILKEAKDIALEQETLEEAASRLLYSKYPYHPPLDSGYWKDMFIEGASYQAERMYSEAIEFAEWIRIKDFQTATGNKWIGLDMKYYTTQELFEQFKKK